MSFEDIQFPAATGGPGWRNRLKVLLGRAIGTVAPRFAADIAQGKMRDRIGRPERLVIAALVDRHARAGTLGQLAPLHAWLWRGPQALSFHAQAQRRYDEWWLQHHSAIVGPLQHLLEGPADAPGPYVRVCEIGCGSGLILEDLARRLPSVSQFVGLDLSPEQTASNRQRRVDPRITFEAGDAMRWVPAHGAPGTIYLTVAGVFEYFRPADLAALFASMRRQAPAAVALIEPIPADYDPQAEQGSRPYGFENSLAHNYPALLRDAGFTIGFSRQQNINGHHFLLLVAQAGRS